MTVQVEVGAEITFAYPFVRVMASNEDGPDEFPSWQPDVRHEATGMGDTDTFADGIGEQIVTVVSLHKPGKYPTRVFFTRKWRSPEGKLFGKNGLHIKSLAGFRSLINGFRHEYDLAEQCVLLRPARPAP